MQFPHCVGASPFPKGTCMIEIYVLDWAARKGHAEVVKVLINFTADPNAPDKDGNTPIHFAAMEGHLDVVKALIAFVYPPNVKNKLGKTPIYYASMNGYAEIVKILSNQNVSKLCIIDRNNN